MISANPDTFSSLDQRCAGSEQQQQHLLKDSSEHSRTSFTCTGSFRNGLPTDWTLSNHSKELCRIQNSPEFESPLAQIQAQQPPNSDPAIARPRLALRQSTSSIASSIQTAIQISSSTVIEPTSTCRTARGSFVESESGSARVLSDLALKSLAENPPGPDPESPDDPDTLLNGKSSKIQFHDVVRIAGGISSHPKRKRSKRHAPRPISADRDPRFSRHDPSSRSPLRYSGTVEGLPNYPNRNSDWADIRSVGYRQAARLDPRDSSSSPIDRSFAIHRQTSVLRPGPPSARSSFSYRSHSDSLSPSVLNHLNGPSGSHRPSSSLSFTRTLSGSSSFTPNDHRSTTLTSRSSSPSSSLYLPLRIPLVRAPAPFFGPTPERVARVRERRQVAQRDAERAKGGWKAWWNDWYHPSDKLLAARKGKAKHDVTHDHHDHHDRDDEPEESDSEDGSCYHDVILEHERTKLERKLRKLAHIGRTMEASRPEASGHRRKKAKLERRDVAGPRASSWLGWVTSLAVGTPGRARAAAPKAAPPPGTGILRLPPGAVQPAVPVVSACDLVPDRLPTVGEITSQTPLLAQPVPHYDHPSPHSGPAPRRWLKLAWWKARISRLFHAALAALVAQFVNIFRIDFGRRYEGCENV